MMARPLEIDRQTVSYDNYVVGATCFLPAEDSDDLYEFLRNVNRFVIDLMKRRGYSPNETSSWEVQYRKPVLSMTFSPTGYDVKPSIPDKAKGVLKMRSRTDISVEHYHNLVKRTMDEIPSRISCTFDIHGSRGEIRGWHLRIEIEPTILLKHRIFGKSLLISQEDYESIVSHGMRFLRELVAGLPGDMVKEPGVLAPRETFREKLYEDLSSYEFPKEVANCLRVANDCFSSQLYLPCSVMIRKAIEVAVTKKFFQTRKEGRMFDGERNEISLEKKLNLLVEINPKSRKDIEQIRLVKWLGDRAAHDPVFDVLAGDIKDNFPRVLSFLGNLQLKQ